MYRSSNKPIAAATLFASAILSMASAAGAQDKSDKSASESAVDYSAEAFKKYESGLFAEAIALYLKAFDASKDARILYNIAQIYDKKLHDGELATTFYRRYLKAEGQEPELAKRSLDRIAALSSDEAKAPPSKASPQEKKAPDQATKAGANQPAASPPSSNTNVPAIVAWSATGVLVVGAVATGVLAVGASSEMRETAFIGPIPESVANASSRAKTLALLTDVLAGSAVVVAGVSLYLTLVSGGSSARATLRRHPWLAGQF
jgi:hypothetical protein